VSRESRAARLRAKADRLDPGGALVPLSLPRGGQYHATWESCCDVHFFNTTGIGAPMFIRAGDEHRLTDETTVVTADHHGNPVPSPHQ